MRYAFHLCFFFNAPATTEIYTLSLHDALPIYPSARGRAVPRLGRVAGPPARRPRAGGALWAVPGARLLLRAPRPLLQVLARAGARDGPASRSDPQAPGLRRPASHRGARQPGDGAGRRAACGRVRLRGRRAHSVSRRPAPLRGGDDGGRGGAAEVARL